MAAHTSGFFKTPALHGQRQSNYEIINVGGEQFHAAAVALIDYMQNGLAINDSTVKKILGRFYEYFPQYTNNDAYLTTPKERLSRLLQTSRKSELVECMAYVLRQLTVDEIMANPLNLNYRAIFADFNQETSVKDLRDPKTQLPVIALKALQSVLELPITLSFKELGKELRKQENLGQPGQHGLVIQVQGDKYFPAVNHKADFAYVGQLAVTVKPVVSDEQENTIKQILAEIHAADQEILRAYEQQQNTILSMVAAGELSYAQLRDYYIELLPYQDNNAGYIRQLQQAAHPILVGAPESAGKNTVEERARALASWIVADAIKADALFDRIDNTIPAQPAFK